ncbi:hypothetical protein IJI29_01380 [Candidatus Saccharibacteria bacterium]|nr:hypothetical protein [Candidatus Saccharibacteria bacterium]
MEGQEYLNQISALNRPTKKSMPKFLSSKLFIFGAGALILSILMMIVGAIISSGRISEKDSTYALKLHLDNTAVVMKSYQPSVKSSTLRSNSASLYSVLTNTSKNLDNYLTEKYDFREKDSDNKIAEQATLEKDDLESELFNAKINGILDRIYAHKIIYEISALMNEESTLLKKSKDESLKNILTTSYQSLENLYKSFSEYSETK